MPNQWETIVSVVRTCAHLLLLQPGKVEAMGSKRIVLITFDRLQWSLLKRPIFLARSTFLKTREGGGTVSTKKRESIK
jgi:hypothetical protein